MVIKDLGQEARYCYPIIQFDISTGLDCLPQVLDSVIPRLYHLTTSYPAYQIYVENALVIL